MRLCGKWRRKGGRKEGNWMEVVKVEKNGIYGLIIDIHLDPTQGRWLGAFSPATAKLDCSQLNWPRTRGGSELNCMQ